MHEVTEAWTFSNLAISDKDIDFEEFSCVHG